MRIVIAGAAGFIGCHLANRCLEDGHEVVGMDNFVTGQRDNITWLAQSPRFSFIEQDVSDGAEAPGDVDLVYNLACPASPVDFGPRGLEILRVCSDGVRHLLHLARSKNAVFLHTSTSEVYGDPEVHPQPETYWGRVNPIGPRAVYDEGKRFAEALIVAFSGATGLRVRIARIFNTFGPHMRMDDGRVVTNFICQALAHRPLTVHGDGSQTRSLCYVDDQVEGLIRLAACDYDRPVNIGNPVEITMLRLAREVIELTGSTSRIDFQPAPPDDPKLRRPDIALARTLLDWQPQVDRREGLARTIAFCRRAMGRGAATHADS